MIIKFNKIIFLNNFNSLYTGHDVKNNVHIKKKNKQIQNNF